MTKVPAMKAPPAPWDDIPWEQWEDWRWQLANRLTTVEQICEVIHLTEAEKTGIANSLNQLRMAINLTTELSNKTKNVKINRDCPPWSLVSASTLSGARSF